MNSFKSMISVTVASSRQCLIFVIAFTFMFVVHLLSIYHGVANKNGYNVVSQELAWVPYETVFLLFQGMCYFGFFFLGNYCCDFCRLHFHKIVAQCSSLLILIHFYFVAVAFLCGVTEQFRRNVTVLCLLTTTACRRNCGLVAVPFPLCWRHWHRKSLVADSLSCRPDNGAVSCRDCLCCFAHVEQCPLPHQPPTFPEHRPY